MVAHTGDWGWGGFEPVSRTPDPRPSHPLIRPPQACELTAIALTDSPLEPGKPGKTGGRPGGGEEATGKTRG